MIPPGNSSDSIAREGDRSEEGDQPSTGKTTLLKSLAGKHMAGGSGDVGVLNGSAFHDTQLVCNGDLSYLGGSWSWTIGSAGDVPLQGDLSSEHMIFGGERSWLIYYYILICGGACIKPHMDSAAGYKFAWVLTHVRPMQVLLLDEITVDLDIVIRMDLLDFFKEECEQREATIVYATHIFDGLETWVLLEARKGESNYVIWNFQRVFELAYPRSTRVDIFGMEGGMIQCVSDSDDQ